MSSSISHWPWYQVAQNSQAQVKFGWRTWHAWLLEHPECARNFLPWQHLGKQALQHSVILAEDQLNAPITCHPFKYNRRMDRLHFCNVADGCWWEKIEWLFGHHWTCAESTLHTLFISPSSWWRYSKHLLERFQLLQQLQCMKYWVYIQGQISFVLCGVHPLPVLRLHCKGSSVSSWPFLIAFTYQLRISYEGTCFPKPSFNDVQNSRALLPNKTWNTVNVLTSICTNLPQSIEKQQTSKSRGTFVTTAIVSLAPHPWFEFSYVKHCMVPPLYTKLLKWPMHLTRTDKCCQWLLAMPAVG